MLFIQLTLTPHVKAIVYYTNINVSHPFFPQRLSCYFYIGAAEEGVDTKGRYPTASPHIQQRQLIIFPATVLGELALILNFLIKSPTKS